MKNILPKSSFARGVGVLAGGTTGAQVLLIIAAPLLTRLYTPEEFGVLAVYTGLLALLSVVASLRYEIAIPLPECHTEACNLLILSFLTVIFISLFTGFLVLFWADELAMALGAPQLARYFWLLPIGVFLSGIYNVLNYWAVRMKAFSDIAATRINQAVATLAIQLIGFKLGSLALLLGQAVGRGVGSVRLLRSFAREGEYKNWSWKGVRQMAVEHKRLPFFSTWSALFNTAGIQLPPLMLAIYFGSSSAGLYSLAHRILALPMAVLGGAVAKVFFGNASEAHRGGHLKELVRKTHAALVGIAMPVSLTLVLAAPDLFSMIFGEEWKQAGEFAQWMAPWLYLVFITSPLTALFTIMKKEQQLMFFEASLLLLRVGAIILGARFGGILGSIILFSLVSAFSRVGILLWICFKSGNTLRSFLHPTASSFIKSLLCLLPLGSALSLTEDLLWMITSLVTSLLLLMLYYFIIFRGLVSNES